MCEPLSVDPAGPAGMAGDVVLLRPLSLQEPLGPAVAHLLFPERAHRVSAMVPDHGSRAEPQRLAAFAQPPAQVYVVSGDTELGIETAHRLEGGFAHGHVAPWNVLRFPIGHENVSRVAGCIPNAFGEPSITGGPDVGTAHRRMRRAAERGGNVGKPV